MNGAWITFYGVLKFPPKMYNLKLQQQLFEAYSALRQMQASCTETSRKVLDEFQV